MVPADPLRRHATPRPTRSPMSRARTTASGCSARRRAASAGSSGTAVATPASARTCAGTRRPGWASSRSTTPATAPAGLLAREHAGGAPPRPRPRRCGGPRPNAATEAARAAVERLMERWDDALAAELFAMNVELDEPLTVAARRRSRRSASATARSVPTRHADGVAHAVPPRVVAHRASAAGPREDGAPPLAGAAAARPDVRRDVRPRAARGRSARPPSASSARSAAHGRPSAIDLAAELAIGSDVDLAAIVGRCRRGGAIRARSSSGPSSTATASRRPRAASRRARPRGPRADLRSGDELRGGRLPRATEGNAPQPRLTPAPGAGRARRRRSEAPARVTGRRYVRVVGRTRVGGDDSHQPGTVPVADTCMTDRLPTTRRWAWLCASVIGAAADRRCSSRSRPGPWSSQPSTTPWG